jgi:hypothetical protein
MKKISKDLFLAPKVLFTLYIILSCIVIMGFRFIAPAEPPPIAIYSQSWRIIQGVLTYIGLFPALTMSGLVLPFGIRSDLRGEFPRFSPEFLDHV